LRVHRGHEIRHTFFRYLRQPQTTTWHLQPNTVNPISIASNKKKEIMKTIHRGILSVTRAHVALALIIPMMIAAGCGSSSPAKNPGTGGHGGMAGGAAGAGGSAAGAGGGDTAGAGGSAAGAGGTMNVTLTSIAVTPASPTIMVGGTQQFVATGTYSDGSHMDLSGSATWTSATTATATISATGLATAVAKGTTVITATSNGVSGTAALMVTAPAMLVSIAVTPATPSIAMGTTTQFIATGTFDDTTTMDISGSVTWASATTATATISAAGLATGVAGGMSVISATKGAIMGSTTLTVTSSTLVSIAVTPPTPSIAKGTTKQFVATGTFKDQNNVMTTQDISASVLWSSGTAPTATISATGLATGVAPGTSVITATKGTVLGTTTLTVTAATLVSIAVTPAAPTVAKGTKPQFTATGTFSDTTTQDLTATATWASATPATATISNAAGSQGQATTLAAGTTIITAASGGVTSPNVTLTVTAATLVSIAVTPATPQIAKGTKVLFTATGTYSDATTQNLTAMATWASATAATATISNAAGSNGLASGVAMGTSVVSATLGAISGNTTLKVTNATLMTIAVTPALPTIAQGSKKQFTATGFFSDATTQDVTITATWASATPARATVSNAAGSVGVVTAVSAGTSVVSAAIGAISGNTTVTVSPAVLATIAVTPAAPSIAKGTTQQFVATGTFTDGSHQDVTAAATWASATAATATISNAAATVGLANAAGVGTSVISATIGNISGNTTLTVTAATLVSISVTPATPSIAPGTTQQFAATGTYSDQTVQTLTATATWASATAATATISNATASKGLASAVAAGTSVISATVGTVVGTTTLTVTHGSLASIAVTPALPSIAKGTTQQFVATGTFDDQTTQDLTTSVTWASATAAAATISNAADSIGEATGVAAGTSVISATLNGKTGSTTLTVTSANLVSIAVTPTAPSVPKGNQPQFVATGFFDDATTQDVTDVATWASSKPAVATISNAAGSNGLADTLTVGTSTISAAIGTISGSTGLTVTAATLVSIAVTPATPSIAKGTRQQFTATGTYTDNTTQNLTATATWASATAATATISNANDATRGRASAVAVGTTVISATQNGVKGMTTLTVTAATLVSIAVTPALPSIAKGTSQQFVATGTYTDATAQIITDTVTWDSATAATATISNAAGSHGLATGADVGTSVITATLGTVHGMTTLTVTAATLMSITVTPAAPSVAKGMTKQFTATGTFSDASTQDLTNVATWVSATMATATIDSAGAVRGLATTLAAGTTVISATRNGVTGMTTLTVTP
jgi:hypothetical protein